MSALHHNSLRTGARLGPLGVAVFLVVSAAAAGERKPLYVANRAPLAQSHFISLPVGAIKPEGWLLTQCRTMANGLSGHLQDFWSPVSSSLWRGVATHGSTGESGPYFLDGLIPLAYELDDPRLIEEVRRWTGAMLSHPQWLDGTGDPWERAIVLKCLMQYYDVSGSDTILSLIARHFTQSDIFSWQSWAHHRGHEQLLAAYWLYNRTGDTTLLRVADTLMDSTMNYTTFFLSFPYPNKLPHMPDKQPYDFVAHGVNTAMGVKYPGLRWLRTGEADDRRGGLEAVAVLDKYHGQAGGRFSADEFLAGLAPSQGTETCATVEYMFSLEKLIEIFGDASMADRLEILTFNSLPGAITPDGWARQYDTQSNQVLVSDAERDWTSNSSRSNMYGLQTHYPCCTANMHQGWPKYVAHQWMATPDRGLAAVAYGPCRVTALVADSVPVTIRQVTDYPFKGRILLEISANAPVTFPLYLRIPGWSSKTTITHRGTTLRPAATGTFFCFHQQWSARDTVLIDIPLPVRTETRYNGAVSVLRGPLYYSLAIDEEWKVNLVNSTAYPSFDWEIKPLSPWNYGLAVDTLAPGDFFTVNEHPVGDTVWSRRFPPVEVRVPARRIPEWGMEKNSAAVPPRNAVSAESLTTVMLIPYGNTRLRITEFPLLEPGPTATRILRSTGTRTESTMLGGARLRVRSDLSAPTPVRVYDAQGRCIYSTVVAPASTVILALSPDASRSRIVVVKVGDLPAQRVAVDWR